MSTLPDITYLDSDRTAANMKTSFFGKILDVMAELPGGKESIPELTISSGTVTATAAVHAIDTEGDAASDDLDNIDTTNMPAGRLLIIGLANSARHVTVTHEAGGNGQVTLRGGADLTLARSDQFLLLRSDGTDWKELDRWGFDIRAAAFLGTLWAGCTPENDTDSDHDIKIPAGSFTLTDGSGNYKLFTNSSDLTKQIDANWSSGDDSGGFPSGLSLSANTMYYMFLIGKDDGTIDAGFDTSSSAANLLSDATGYTWYGKVRGNFAVFTDGSSNIRPFTVTQNWCYFDSPVTDVDDSSLTEAALETGTLSVPPSSIAKARAYFDGSNTYSIRGDVRVNAALDMILASVKDDDADDKTINVTVDFPVDGSSQFQYRLYVAGTGSETVDRCIFETYGFQLLH